MRFPARLSYFLSKTIITHIALGKSFRASKAILRAELQGVLTVILGKRATQVLQLPIQERRRRGLERLNGIVQLPTMRKQRAELRPQVLGLLVYYSARHRQSLVYFTFRGIGPAGLPLPSDHFSGLFSSARALRMAWRMQEVPELPREHLQDDTRVND